MDFIILYERKQRELENAILLKIELEKRNYSCEIYQFYEADKFNILNRNSPKVLLVPSCYSSAAINYVFSRYGRPNQLVSLQYEQVLSERWEKLGFHNPKDEAKKAIHICWGIKTKKRLEEVGISSSNTKVLGALHLDLLRKEYRQDVTQLKSQLGEKFNLSIDKRWIIFLSSFSYANMDEHRLKQNASNLGINLEDVRKTHTDSRDKLLDWFKKILEKDTKNIFIYRPHPSEINLDTVMKLEKQYPNFRIIRYSAVKNWIEVSDNIYSWYSTSVVEAHFLDKPYSILRPLELSDDFDSVLLKHATFITEYNAFEKDYFKNDLERRTAIDDFHINQYYQIDKVHTAYTKYCDFLEEIYKSEKQKYTLNVTNRIIAKLKAIAVIVMYFLYKNLKIDLDKYRNENVKRNFFIRWFIEMDDQFVSDDEKKDVENKIKNILAKAKPISSNGY